MYMCSKKHEAVCHGKSHEIFRKMLQMSLISLINLEMCYINDQISFESIPITKQSRFQNNFAKKEAVTAHQGEYY